MSRARIARAAAATSGAAITPAHTAARTSRGDAFRRVIPPMQKNGIPSRFSAARYANPLGARPGLSGVAYIGPHET